MKILVVDDSAFTRRMIRRPLEEAGYDVVEAEDGNRALALYPAERPDVVTLDLLMPGMEGLEVLESLLVIDPGVRVIICTSNVQSRVRHQMLDLGAVGFLNKPIQPEQLCQAVEAAVKGGREVPRLMDDLSVDALVELSNMAINQAAGKLSELTGLTVVSQIPRLRELSHEELQEYLLSEIGPDSPCIRQGFKGGLQGEIILIYPGQSLLSLASAFLGPHRTSQALSSIERSALIEVGNVLVNAFIGMLGSVLKLDVDFNPPELFKATAHTLQSLLQRHRDSGPGAIVLDNEMRVGGADVSGHIVILFEAMTARTLASRMVEIWIEA